ncbi:MAG TPA: F0F1 ATP synthase subunit A [Candidatus Cryptobacteroides merdipullorum]|uniref:ATP synthase subunit a n=1 Tax=Candidatus Cryptobacteroides merdipullorum TaxID=2840771 RepID=A0A9D1GP80_9BACT|nr:F0F1 ATP synthase subunit A [Candidatus Cryptobacteroides merdipullorum]
MRGKLRLIFMALLSLLPLSLNAAEDGGGLDMKSYIFGHVGDAYEWHITKVGDTDISIPLPCIVVDDGLHVFSSKRMQEHGYTLNGDGKLVNAATMERPIDLSITKNVLALMINAALLVTLILLCARWYRKHDVLKEKPTGIAALMEPVVMFVESDLIRDVIGPGYRKYAPYLMTAFFFILINNLMGIVPFFPGGANTTGNIAVTLVLALFTFVMVNVFGTRHYFKEIFWPDVPVFLKAVPLMPIIEIIGVFTKPFSLMIRLFANTLGGHIMILSMVGLIFISASMGAAVNGAFTLVSLLLGVFLDCLEILVAFIQAYVFTLLSAVFISLAHPGGEAVEVMENKN